jgi:hypothetical protein
VRDPLGAAAEPDDADEPEVGPAGATEVVLPRSGKGAVRAAPRPAPTADQRRAAHLAALHREAPGGLLSGDLHQRPWWVRWSLYVLALALAAAATVAAFWLVRLLRA